MVRRKEKEKEARNQRIKEQERTRRERKWNVNEQKKLTGRITKKREEFTEEFTEKRQRRNITPSPQKNDKNDKEEPTKELAEKLLRNGKEYPREMMKNYYKN
ncbi:hypothetical protein C2G38_2222006 [Gigaspora rosea]|uniref:Uncharacterized protein n=1 Tax=Gigaspora rosea TaxID=44941 RepID=A0A397UB84_9GLOM|nr:hypothetical protein C2G38_2222006 [Gigaspora rosea]